MPAIISELYFACKEKPALLKKPCGVVMYPVDLHMHTVASTHAYSTLHDYIVEAKLKNIKLFAITDHGPDMADAPHYWHFMNMLVWPRIVDGVGILRGIEANIKNLAGDIDCTGSMLDAIDLLIAGFHEPPHSQLKCNKKVGHYAACKCVKNTSFGER
jgi:putative hydrolase